MTRPRINMNSISKTLFATALVAWLPSQMSAQTPLSFGHVDIGLEYEDGEIEIHIHDEGSDTEYSAAEAVLVVNPSAQTASPGGNFEPYLGSAGTPFWLLGTSPQPDVIFLGFATEELSAADWIGDITLTLTSVDGPGEFSLWSVDSFGEPTFLMSSTDGIAAEDSLTLGLETHVHFNLGFTEPGDYLIGFQASGMHATDGLVSSDPTSVAFQIVPEPQTWALMILGTGALAWTLRRQRRP